MGLKTLWKQSLSSKNFLQIVGIIDDSGNPELHRRIFPATDVQGWPGYPTPGKGKDEVYPERSYPLLDLAEGGGTDI